MGQAGALFDEMLMYWDPRALLHAEALLRCCHGAPAGVPDGAADAAGFYGLPPRDVAATMEELARQTSLSSLAEGYPRRPICRLQAQVFLLGGAGVLAHYAATSWVCPLVRCGKATKEPTTKSGKAR